MKKNRRNFIQRAGILSAGALILPQFACKGNEKSTSENTDSLPAVETSLAAGPSISQFGIQLYTLRDDMPKDPKGVLKQLSSFGYKQIEGYEGKQGMFWDMTPKDYKLYLDDLGLNMVSSHCDIKKDFELKAEQAASIGMKYLICPYVGPQRNMDEWKKITEQFNECGDICQKNGIRFAYHNHAYSFIPFSGMIPHDFLMENTNPDTVDHEMDIYWVVTGGADPIEYLKKYPNRFRLCHVKDRMKDAGDEREASCDLGTGIIDYPSILKVAEEQGMQYFIVEQERYDNSTPLKSAEHNADYLSKLTFA